MDWLIQSRPVVDAVVEAYRLFPPSLSREGDCLVHGGKSYGRFRGYSMHRVAYAAAHGPIPVGYVVGHKCDNPRCVNPDHLEAITQGKNARDAVARGLVSHERGTQRYNHVIDEQTAKKIAELHIGGMGRVRISAALGLPPNLVKKVLEGRTWAHVTGFGDRHKKPAVPYTTASTRRNRLASFDEVA